MKAEESPWNICTDTEGQHGENIARPRLYQRDRVGKERGTERKGGEDARCEDATQTFLHTDALSPKRFYTQKPLHTQTYLHRSFSHTCFYTLTQTPFVHYAYIFAQTLLNTDTETLLHTNAFTHKRFYTQTCFCTHRCLYPQKLLQTNTFTHRTPLELSS